MNITKDKSTLTCGNTYNECFVIKKKNSGSKIKHEINRV